MLFSCTGLEGHFRPMLPLAHALSHAGHEVAFATAAGWSRASPPRDSAPCLPGSRTPKFYELHGPRGHSDHRSVTPMQRREIVVPASGSERPRAGEVRRSCWRSRDRGDPTRSCTRARDLAAPLVAAMLGVPPVNHSFGSLVPLLGARGCASEMVAPMWLSQRARSGAVRRLVHRAVRRHLPAGPGLGGTADRADRRCGRASRSRRIRRTGSGRWARRWSTSRSGRSSTILRSTGRCSTASPRSTVGRRRS